MGFYNYVHIDSILEKLRQAHIPGVYWNLGEIKEWVYEALSMISSRDGKIYNKISLDIVDNKVKIPVDVEYLDKVVHDGIVLMEIGTDDYLTKTRYFINFGYIYLHKDLENNLDLYYNTAPLAEDGSPLIPDNDYYKNGILAYLRFKIGDRAYYQKKILERQRDKLEQEWNFYIKATQAHNKSRFLNDSKRFRRIAKRFY